MEIDFLKIPFEEFETKVESLIKKADSLLSVKVNTESEYTDLKNERWELVKACENNLLEAFNNGYQNSFYTGFRESISNMGYVMPGMKPELSKMVNTVQENLKEIKRQLEYLLKLFKGSDAVKNPDTYHTDRIDMTIDEKETFLMVKLYDLYQNGLQGYLSVKDIFYSNRIPVDYMEDIELTKSLKFLGFIEDVGSMGGPYIRLKTEGRRAVQQHLRQEPKELAIPQASSVTVNIGSAGFVGSGNQIHNSTISSVVNHGLPDNTNYENLQFELEQLKAHLLTKASSGEHYDQIGNITRAIEAAKENDGNKVVEFLKKGSSWMLDGAKDIAIDVVAEIIKKSLFPQ